MTPLDGPIHEERIALFLDYENLAIGARDELGGMTFDFGPVADALAERGRVVVRRAYADWSSFDDDRRMLTRHHVELIEIPQRMGEVRKNAADIKMAVDAVELSFERDYITTFVIGTGDSDFTPLVHKLRELNKRVIGLGVRGSTSNLLPPACDEFLFYDTLEGVEPRSSGRGRGRGGRTRGTGRGKATKSKEAAGAEAGEAASEAATAGDDDSEREQPRLDVLVTRTLAGLKRSGGDTVLASNLKRTILRKDPTFSEADHGFRGFVELLRHLERQGVVSLSEGGAKGDPEVDFPAEQVSGEEEAFRLLAEVVVAQSDGKSGSAPPLSGLKDQLRRRDPEFTEKRFGYGGFLQFVKAAAARGVVDMAWDDEADDYLVRVPEGA
ncbi:MAG TPA: NYN domain-containing protein [Acidimicrobiia bacterium]|nr:NYN domain-containing protein [Acidimicrobiia bacterium]